MNRLSTKRIAAVAAGAALLGVGLAFAGPVTFQNVQIIGSSGQPLVQIVVGSKAAISDGIAAANIAAAIGNLAYTSVAVTATVNTSNANNVLHVTVSNPGAATITNQQVWLNTTGATTVSGAYSFTALIGSVLNRAVQVGAPQYTKVAQGNTNYAYPESASLTVSPAASPYSALGSVPRTTVTTTSGGGMAYSSFTNSSDDNILEVTASQLPSLLANSGSYGESELLWLTGFPVFDQASGVNAFTIQSVGGAYQVAFAKPIVMSTTSGGTGVNNAAFKFLGQNWTIIGYELPGASTYNITLGAGSGTKTATSTTVVNGGHLIVASSLSPLATIYVGQNLTGGAFKAQLTDIGQPNSNGVSPAAINLYYNGALTNVTSIQPGTTASFNVSGVKVYLKVNQTFAGLYAYQKYAKMQLYSNVFKLNDGSTYNQTNDPGWNVNLLWTNTSSSGNAIALQGILVYNATPGTLMQGQSFTFIHNPAAWSVQFLGDTLGSNYDPLNWKTSSTSSAKFQLVTSTFSATSTGVNGSINNITEPAQYLTLTSSINNAFSFGGQQGSTAQYNLDPYELFAGNFIGNQGSNTVGNNVNIRLQMTGNFVNTNNPLTVTLKGSSNTLSETNSIVFTSPNANQLVWTPFTNITSIQLSSAYPGVTITLNSVNAVSSNTVSLITLPPTLLYQQSGKNYMSQVSGANVIYNQQNGQPLATFTIAATSGTPSQNAASAYFVYNAISYPVPGTTSFTSQHAFSISNASSGVTAAPLFWVNASAPTGTTPGTRNNITYTSTQNNQVNVGPGFKGERGGTFASDSATSLTINYATQVDSLQFAVSPSTGGAVTTTNQHQYGPFSVGQAVNIPGVHNVTVSKITGTATLGAGATYSISGLSNLTATPSVSQATTAVWLSNLTTTPLVVLDSQANPASSLVLVGSGYVNSVSKQVESSQNITVVPSTQIVQAYGNKIYVAGYTAAQTTAAANQFIQDLYAAATH